MNQLKTTLILAPIADAAASTKFQVNPGRPVTVISHAALGLVAAQHADIQVSHDGVLWQDLFVGTVQQRLNTTNTQIALDAPGIYRVNKGVTTNPVGISIHQ